ncbi:MAG: ATP-binding cassette domain-containing protein [Bacteroidales bacterium]
MTVIKCSQITKKFGDYTALNSVDFEIPKNKIFGLLGPNGAGKTTLIRILNQITTPDSGKVYFDGKPLKPNDVQRIGYLPEERGLYRKMEVGEQSVYLARLKGMSRRDATRELKLWFEKFDILSWWNKKVQDLSKGMAQKIQFIITIIHKPELLILDEPFSGFDPVNVKLVRDEILRLKNEGTTIILSTHNMESVEEMCDEIALINKSNLILTGNVLDIRKKYGKNRIEVLYEGEEELSTLDFPHKIISDELVGLTHRCIIELNYDIFNTGNKYYRGVLNDKYQKNDLENENQIDRDIITNNIILSELIKRVEVVGYSKLMPRMEDIFIDLVKRSDV